MPPAISESEDETYETMAHVGSQKKNKKNGNKARESAHEEEEEVLNVESADEKEDDDDDDDEEKDADDVYTVEKILSHRFDEDGKIFFNIKWEGYEKLADRTWEPEENLDTAKDMVEEYLDSLGGREKVLGEKLKAKKGTNKRGRASNVSTPASTKKAKTISKSVTRSVTPDVEGKAFQPPTGSWEDEVKAIDAAEGAEGQVQVYLTWRDGHKTQHPLEVCYKRCPQKMLRFFESHLVLLPPNPAIGTKANGKKVFKKASPTS